MTLLELDGLTFRVTSPSCWELVHTWPDVHVFMRFNGFKWVIQYSDASHGVTRFFKLRDEAVALLASRRTA